MMQIPEYRRAWLVCSHLAGLGWEVASGLIPRAFVTVGAAMIISLVPVLSGGRGRLEADETPAVTPAPTASDGGLPVTTATNRQVSPAVASDGVSALVLWSDERDGWNVNGALVRPDATSKPAEIAISTAQNSQSNPELAWVGAHYLALWDDGRSGRYSELYLARVGPNGEVFDPDGVLFSSGPHHQNHPALAWGDGVGLVTWQDYRSGRWEIYAARISADGENLEPDGILVATGPESLWSPDVAWDGSNFLVVWQDTRGDYYDIFGARISSEGTLLDPDYLEISTTMPAYQYQPSVVWGAGAYLVAWDDGTSIWVRRVAADGAIPDSSEVLVCAAYGYQSGAAVTWTGQEFLVVWADTRSGSTSTDDDVYGARISTDGEVLDPDGFPISTMSGSQYEPQIARAGQTLVTVWTDTRSGSYAHDIYAALFPRDDVDQDGVFEIEDNCPVAANSDQADEDEDAVGDVCDNCPTNANPDQADANGNGTGDVCETIPGCSMSPVSRTGPVATRTRRSGVPGGYLLGGGIVIATIVTSRAHRRRLRCDSARSSGRE